MKKGELQAIVSVKIDVDKIAELYSVDGAMFEDNPDYLEDLITNEFGWLEKSGIVTVDVNLMLK